MSIPNGRSEVVRYIGADEMVGERVDLAIEYEQKPLPLVYETEEAATEAVDVEDVCDYDAIADERGLPVGGDADE